MAAASDLKGVFSKYAKKNDGKEATSKDLTKMFTDAKLINKKACTTQNLDIIFSKVKPKGKSTITFNELEAVIKEKAKAYSKDHKGMDEGAAIEEIKTKLAAASPDFSKGTTKQSKTGGVDKMTDASKYTGSHKERFDASGKGKGKEGRADAVDDSGYVGNYKGEGTFEEKTE